MSGQNNTAVPEVVYQQIEQGVPAWLASAIIATVVLIALYKLMFAAKAPAGTQSGAPVIHLHLKVNQLYVNPILPNDRQWQTIQRDVLEDASLSSEESDSDDSSGEDRKSTDSYSLGGSSPSLGR